MRSSLDRPSFPTRRSSDLLSRLPRSAPGRVTAHLELDDVYRELLEPRKRLRHLAHFRRLARATGDPVMRVLAEARVARWLYDRRQLNAAKRLAREAYMAACQLGADDVSARALAVAVAANEPTY